MQAHNLLKERIVFVIIFMPDDIIGKQALAFFWPLLGHTSPNGSLITMVTFHGSAKAGSL